MWGFFEIVSNIDSDIENKKGKCLEMKMVTAHIYNNKNCNIKRSNSMLMAMLLVTKRKICLITIVMVKINFLMILKKCQVYVL